MKDSDGETATQPLAYDEVVAGVNTAAEQARRRAETEREAVEWAIDELESLIVAAWLVIPSASPRASTGPMVPVRNRGWHV
ncbi:peptidase C45 acyl-coenzyme A:6- aminopenicillanic acid acyl-transferase [Halobiforma nitratireducens JCM 10879]|uniref:Peptidase C45 acyl-coenzyme A:6-aminopenicillanic acid acyl-transferase n=1 Tax=Halobiforma nitratireducens JCM 10879 TaxID=1227454 RepID=M0MPQ8_9EURY|nr:peptidase C45 acyl-coenzyme A:6- aminopenicillanic acid acyl-transferase [Halobiforma nitratireducens JCM 10879]